jgi:hypothetical protein
MVEQKGEVHWLRNFSLLLDDLIFFIWSDNNKLWYN